jgi:hypothetical protein
VSNKSANAIAISDAVVFIIELALPRADLVSAESPSHSTTCYCWLLRPVNAMLHDMVADRAGS